MTRKSLIVVATLWLALTAPAGALAAKSLEQIYQTELEVLSAEKQALEEARASAESSAQSARRALKKSLESLTQELIRLRAQNAGREVSLPLRERIHSLDDQDRELRDLLGQIETRLLLQGGTLSGSGEDPERLATLIAATLDRLARHGSVHVDLNKTYYDRLGRARSGQVLHIGEFAAFSLAEGKALIPGPNGSFRALPLRATIEHHPEGSAVRTVLYDPQNPPLVDSFRAPGMAAWFKRGGLLMWPLLVLGVAALMVALERTLTLGAIQILWRQAALGTRTRPSWLVEPLAAVDSQESTKEDRATAALLCFRARLYRRFTLLGVAATVAPLLGLLGTVTGMITTFAIISEYGTGDPRRVSEGIAEALLTTQFGLAIAIPALVVHVALKRWGHRIFVHAEKDVLARLHPAKPSGELEARND